MKASKAIEILEDIIHYVEPSDPPEEHQAVQLGIEALKRHRDRDYFTYSGMHEPLPGETPPEKVE